MDFSFDQILPSLQALGLWSYWIIGLSSFLEAFFITGIAVPGTVVVDIGGVLVERGFLEYFDLAWFVAIGSFLGGELSYWVGVYGAAGLKRHMNIEKSEAFHKARRLFERHGGMALVIGRFTGPIAGVVPLVAGASGMEHKRFALWNLSGAFPYALFHVGLGYFLGDAFFTLGPFASRVMLFTLVVFLAIALIWYFVIRIKKLVPFVRSVSLSMFKAARENPDMQRWIAKHPGTFGFITRRLDTSHFFGLTASLLFVVFLYLLFIWVGTVFDFLMAEQIVQIDLRLANLVHAFWNPTLLKIFTHITVMGNARVVGVLFSGILLGLWLYRRIDLLVGLVIAMAGNVASVAFFKSFFHRPRPEFAYFIETSGSFPSGHAAISVAFYGMVVFVIWRLRMLGAFSALFLAVNIAFFIGLSRIFLIEHYLSDVLNGYLVGALWLVVAIAVSGWWNATRPAIGPVSVNRRLLASGVIALSMLMTGWIDYGYTKERNRHVASSDTQIIDNIADLFTSGKAPPTSDSILGTPLEPISLIIVSADVRGFEAAMARSGWHKADEAGIVTLSRAALDMWSNQPYQTAPITPYFWNDRPHDLGFQKSTGDKSARKRYHARFWNTGFVTKDGANIIVGTASFDDGLSWSMLHHIAPNIDRERDRVIDDLRRTGEIADETMFRLSTPRLGTDVVGDPWFTDGKAVIARLKR